MNDLGRHEQAEPSPEAGTGGDGGFGRASRHRSWRESGGHSGDVERREKFAGSHCGHRLSMIDKPGDEGQEGQLPSSGREPARDT